MTDILIGFFDMVGSFINSVLPTLSDTGFSNISAAIGFFAKFIGAANYLFPVDTLVEIFSLYISIKLFLIGWWFFAWLIRTVRG